MSILEQAKAVQAKRKKRYGDADKKRNSKIRRKPTEKNLEVWSRNPGRSDIIGVDGEGTPTLKRDQEPTPRPKRKKAAPKRKKAEVKAQPKAEPKPEPKKGELTGVVNGPDLSDWKAFNRFTVLKVTGPLVNRKYVTFAVRWQKGSIKEYEYSGPGIRQRETKLYDYGSKAREYLAKKVRDYITSLQNARIKAGLEPAKIEFLQIAKPSDTYMDPGYRYMTEKEIGEYIKSDAVYRDVLQQDLKAYLKAKELRENPPKMTPEQEAELTKKADFSYIELAKKRRKELIQQRKQIKGRDAGLEAKIRNEGYKIDRFSEKKKKPQADTGRYELRKWVPGSDDVESYQVYVGEAPKKLVGLIFKRKPDKFPRESFLVRRDPWGFMIFEQGQIIYTTTVYDGFKTKEKAITGLKNRWGFDRIYGYWEKVQESYEKRKDEPRSAQYEAEAYRAMTDKDARRSISAYNSMELYNTMAYLYSKGYVIPLPTGWQIGTPEHDVYNLKKGPNFDKWNPVLPESLSVQLEGKNWWKAPGAGTAVSKLQEIAKEYGTSKGYDFADLNEAEQRRLKVILPISIDEAERRDELETEGLGNIVSVSDRFKRYWNVFVKSANDALPLKTASDAMIGLTYDPPDKVGGRKRQEWFDVISEAETSAVEILLKRKSMNRLSKEEIEYLFDNDDLAAYMLKARQKMFGIISSYFAGLSREMNSDFTGRADGKFPFRRMEKIRAQNHKKMGVILEETRNYARILKSYFDGSKFQAKKELVERRERAEELGLKAVRKEVDLGVWEYDPGTSRLNFEPAQMLEPDMRTKLRRSPYAMKWSPRFKQYTRVVALDSVPTVGLRNALKRDFDFDLPLPVSAKAAPAPKADNPESIVDNLSAADRSKVSMKIDELAQLADEAKAKGEAAPNYNLCEITIPGTNIYCEGNKGIERAKMPQFKGTPVPGSPAARLPKDGKGEVDTEPIFRKQLKEEGIAITPKEIYSDNLKATQSELVGAKVAGMTKALEANPNNPGITAPIFVSNDNYVIDGHHRWAAVTSYAIKNGLPKKMKVEVIDLPIEEAIKKSNDFADMIGIAQKAAKTEEKKEAPKKAADDSSMDAMLQDALGLNVTWAERKAELMKLAKKYEEASGPARKDIELLYSNLLERTTQNAAGSEPSSDAVCGAMIVQLQIFPNVMRKLRSSVEVSPQFYPYGFNLVTGGMIPNNYLSNSPLWKYMDDLYQSVMYDIKPLKKSKYKLQTQSLGARNMDIAKGKLGKWKDNLKLAVPYLKPYFGKDTLRPAMMSAYVDSFGFTATDAFKLIHLDAENTDWPLSESGSGIYPSPTANNDFGDRIEEKYPNWKAVVPSTTAEEVIYVQGTKLERLYKFVMMQTDYQMFLPIKDVYNIFFKTENGFTAFNTALLVEVIKTIYKLGQSSVTVLYYGETRPSLWIPGTFSSKVVDAERNTYILLMPVLSENLAPRFGSKSKRVLRDGGYIEGPSHAEGGVTMPVGSSGRMVELEGGEGVVNKRSMASQKTITLNGKRMKPCQAVSQINQMDGNGVPITC